MAIDAYPATVKVNKPRRRGLFVQIGASVLFVLRLVLPLIFLGSVFLLADLNSWQSVYFLDAFFEDDLAPFRPGEWLKAGHLIFPLTYFIIHLTNRRYGPNLCVGLVGTLWLVAAGSIVWDQYFADLIYVDITQLSTRIVLAFSVAVIASQVMAIWVYEVTRGHPWWRAPLMASLWASGTFCLIFFVGAFYGGDLVWVNRMITYFALMVGMAIMMLVPYFLLKFLIRPVKGTGYVPD